MGCTYTYPWGHSVQRAFWNKGWSVNGVEPPDLLNDPEYRRRVQFTGDKQHNCTLRLRDVTEKDQSKYYFRFITDQTGREYQGESGVDLSVTDLQVEVPETVTEGDKVTLTCKTSCSLTDSPTFTWYKNGQDTYSKTDQILLQSVSRWNKDRYHCAVWSPMYLKSPEVTLNVRYPPKSVSVSIRPSGETVEDSSVTLTCSSDANPPVQNYTWFKEGETSPVGSGHSYSALQSGSYYCVAQNEYGAQEAAAVSVGVKGIKQRKRRGNPTDEVNLQQNSDPNTKDDTYTALHPMSRSSDDVYHTLATVHSSPSDDPYTALDPQSRSPEYDTLAVSQSSSTEDCLVAL
ncbi:B-cell receptor CD22-like [Hoplias malabaricus]|uniref:B-cell receptor CD22-like n=1 Tax=Hoplias malabaricus TaxID=27720 RepID=UPI0034629F49